MCFANRPDVLTASNSSLSVAIQQASKRCVALELPNDHFGGNTNLHTPARKQSQEQHHMTVQLSDKLMSEEYFEVYKDYVKDYDTIAWFESYPNN